MKTCVSFRVFAILLVLMAAPLAVAAGAPKASPAHCHPVQFAERNSSTSVVSGNTRIQVESALGLPWATLGYDVWIYRNFTVATNCGGGCDRLMITFVNNRVVELQLVNRRAEEIYAARIRANPAEKPIVAKK